MSNHYRAIILGHIWQPGTPPCSQEITLTAASDAEAIRQAMATRGDFSHVIDVKVLRLEPCRVCRCGLFLEVTVKDWESEENELTYWDTVEGADDEDGDDEPCEGDYVLDETGDDCTLYEHGTRRRVFTTSEGRPAVLKFMEGDGYWPNVWVVSDHGNAHLVTDWT